MADTLLHITCARKLLSDGRLNKEAANLLGTHFEDYALGAAIHDLPYYDNILKNGVQKMRGLPQEYAALGQHIHNHHGAPMCNQAVWRADTPSRFAVAAGMVTHFALDIVFHNYIEQRVADTGIAHGTLENEIGLHCHYDLLGHAGVGNDYVRDTMTLHPTAGWEEFYLDLVRATHGLTPGRPYLERCLRGMRLFGALHAVPFVPWVKVLADDDPELATVSLDLLDRSMDKAVTFLNRAWEAHQRTITKKEWRTCLPPLRLADGTPEG